MWKKNFVDIRFVLLWLLFLSVCISIFTWINFSIAGLGQVVQWGWESNLFYILYNQIRTGNLPYIDFFIEYPPLVAYFIAMPWSIFGNFVELSKQDFGALFSLGIGFWLIWFFYQQNKILQFSTDNTKKIFVLLWITLANIIISYTIVFTRFDIFPSIFTSLGFAFFLLYQKSQKLTHFIFGTFLVILAGFLKIYPFVLLPLFFLTEFLHKRYTNLIWIVGIFVFVLSLNLPFLVFGLDNFKGFLAYQQNRSVQIESLYAGPIFVLEKLNLVDAPIMVQNGTNTINSDLAIFVAKFAQPITIIFLVIGFLWLTLKLFRFKQWLEIENYQEILALSAIIFVLTFVIFNFIFSPQYLVWLILLIPLLAFVDWTNRSRTAWFLSGLAILASALTLIIYPFSYELLKSREVLMVWILNLRNFSLLLVWLTLVKLWFNKVNDLARVAKSVETKAT